MDTTWGSDYDVSATRFKLLNVLLDYSTSDACLNFDAHVLTK